MIVEILTPPACCQVEVADTTDEIGPPGPGLSACWILPSKLQMLSAQEPPHTVALVGSPVHVMLHWVSLIVCEFRSVSPQKHWTANSVPAMLKPCVRQKSMQALLVIPPGIDKSCASLRALSEPSS